MANVIAVDIGILGAGTAGLAALREVKGEGRSFVLTGQGPLAGSVACHPRPHCMREH